MAAPQRGFRPRPLDIQKHLTIINDLSQLESTDGVVSRDITHNHEALDKENEEAKMVATAKSKGGKEIPIPDVHVVPSYNVDYLPTFHAAATYLRGRAGVEEESYVEYDLDSEDEAWLADLNKDQQRLSATQFERFLDTLEHANVAANIRADGSAQAGQASSAAVNLDNLSRDDALAAMQQKDLLKEATRIAIYEYWRRKRVTLGRPLLRSLQPPTSCGDTNPFNVFRPREKIHRPQTRRRRENNPDSLDKMKQIGSNITQAREIGGQTTFRESRKGTRLTVELDGWVYSVKRHHEPRSLLERIESSYKEVYTKHKFGAKRPLGFEIDPEPDTLVAPVLKRMRKEPDGSLEQLEPPPLPIVPKRMVDPRYLPVCTPDALKTGLAEEDVKWEDVLKDATVKVRPGRGGRCVGDRVDWLSLTPLEQGAEEPLLPFHLTANPFGYIFKQPNVPNIKVPTASQAGTPRG